jgi:hypothetical protein
MSTSITRAAAKTIALQRGIDEEIRLSPSESKNNTKIRNPKPYKRSKVKNGELEFEIPKIGQHNLILTKRYLVSQLREICKKYGQKRSGTKLELQSRVFDFLRLSHPAVIIQKIWRGFLVREYFKCKGITVGKSQLCNNEVDFLLMTPISEIHYSNLFIFRDIDDFYYGFDILSLSNLVFKSKDKVQNPYNRNIIPSSINARLHKVLRVGQIFGYDVDISLHEEDLIASMTPRQRFEMKAIDLCQKIDALGNHTSTDWILSLRGSDFITMLRELWDIWHYRANILHSVRQEICPPNGNPFNGLDISHLRRISDLAVCEKAITILDRFVASGINEESKSLGAIYVLSALTLVSLEAAQALPWLYQSVAHV